MFSLPGYRIVRELARGGMGIIYLAEHETLNRAVAIKVMSDALAQDKMFAERFVREARMVASLQHPTICSIYDAGVSDETPYMVMEYIEGGTLADRLANGPLDPDQALAITRQIAESLQNAHDQGLIHRDIKPANIMFRANDSVVLTDFGISKSIEEGTSLTVSGTMVGTPHYISPEQAKGEQVDPRSDIYSLGVVLYEMLTGEKAYDGDSAVTVALKHISEPVAQLPAHLAHLQPLLSRMMAKDPQARIPDCQALSLAISAPEQVGEALEPGVSDDRTQAHTIAAQPDAASRTKTAYKPALVGAALLGILGVFALGYLSTDEAAAPAPETESMTSEPTTSPIAPQEVLALDAEVKKDRQPDEQRPLVEIPAEPAMDTPQQAEAESPDVAAISQPDETEPKPAPSVTEPAAPPMTYTLVLQALDMKNCKGITGRFLSRFGAKDEPSVDLNGKTVWPDSPTSLTCPKEHVIDKRFELMNSGAEVVSLNETDEQGGNPVVMGKITEPVARAREEGCLAGSDDDIKVCTTQFNAHDGEYVLIWRIEANAS